MDWDNEEGGHPAERVALRPALIALTIAVLAAAALSPVAFSREAEADHEFAASEFQYGAGCEEAAAAEQHTDDKYLRWAVCRHRMVAMAHPPTIEHGHAGTSERPASGGGRHR